MAHYVTPLSKLAGNVIYGKDGSVWVNYLLRGINVNPYSSGKVSAAQSLNDELFTMLGDVDSTDFLLGGFKAREHPEDVLARCVAGVPDLSGGNYPNLVMQFNELFRKLDTREMTVFKRVYWLSVAMPFDRSMKDKVIDKVMITDPHEGITSKAVREFNRSVFEAIPESFEAERTTPAHLRWIYDRARLRGIDVPILPRGDGDAPMKFSPRSFPQVDYDEACDREASFTRFVEELSSQLNERGAEALKDSRLKETYFNNFRSLHRSRTLGVTNVETSSEKFPDGYTSYQSMLAISAGPNEVSTSVNSFTYLVDQAIGCDADFALRFWYPEDAVSKKTSSSALADLKSENESNSRDELDVEDYGDTIGDVHEMHSAVRSESNPVGMHMSALFAFAHPDHRYLTRRVSTLSKKFSDNAFTTYRAVGGQKDMWTQMMPGVPRSMLTDDVAMVTTAYLFGGSMPVRRTEIGDGKGVPLAVNTENALGQLIHWDILNATKKGNASVTVCGAQGSGKSHLIKLMLAYMLDLNRYAYVIDAHGEYVVFAQTLTDTMIFDVTGREASLDPLKTYDNESGQAAKVFLDLWLPLLGISRDDPMATLLSRMLKWEYRKPRGILTTRQLIEHIRTSSNITSDVLSAKFEFWGEQEYCSALIDPVDRGVVQDLPAFNAGNARCVVFRTSNISVYRGNDSSEADPSELYAAVVYNAIARVASHHFSQIEGSCAFFGDELHFLDGNDRVLDRLIRTPDRTGRKDGNFIVGGSQLASDFGSQYDMVKRRFVLRQEKSENAIEALEWGEIPSTEFLVRRLLEETSPLDPRGDNVPMVGREGEGWYNDGAGNIARVQVLAHLRGDRARMSDTTSGRMIRASELASATP